VISSILKKALPIFALLLSVAPAYAQASWTLTKTADLQQMDQVRYAQLTPAEKAGLQTLTAPALQKCAKLDAADAFQHVRVRRTNLGGGTQGFVVEGSGCLCNAQANCAFWIVTGDMQTLFNGTAQTYALLPQTTTDHFDLVAASHVSTTESTRTLYTFDGKQYMSTQCAGISLATTFGAMQTKPAITLQKCQ
jgi:hypothetical protein